jgi:hypothetical protein
VPPLAVITAPASVQPATPTGRCGPARWVDGVPTGWEDSRAGVVSAAAGYAKTMSTMWFLADRDRRHRAISLLATAEQAATLTASQDLLAAELLDGPLGPALANNGARAVLTTALLGYRLEAFSARSARVALWAVLVYGAATGLLPGAVWTTTTMELARADGDWKLTSAVTREGPTPQSGGLDVAPGELVAAAKTFRGFTDVPL